MQWALGRVDIQVLEVYKDTWQSGTENENIGKKRGHNLKSDNECRF